MCPFRSRAFDAQTNPRRPGATPRTRVGVDRHRYPALLGAAEAGRAGKVGPGALQQLTHARAQIVRPGTGRHKHRLVESSRVRAEALASFGAVLRWRSPDLPQVVRGAGTVAACAGLVGWAVEPPLGRAEAADQAGPRLEAVVLRKHKRHRA
eukprot:scaffold15414_cov114-Isochrysis_galbana.AAC.3